MGQWLPLLPESTTRRPALRPFGYCSPQCNINFVNFNGGLTAFCLFNHRQWHAKPAGFTVTAAQRRPAIAYFATNVGIARKRRQKKPST